MNPTAPANDGFPIVFVRAVARGWLRKARTSIARSCMRSDRKTRRAVVKRSRISGRHGMTTTSQILIGGSQKQNVRYR